MHIPKGYKFAAVAAGFKKPGKLDLGLVVSETEAVAAGVFTTNLFQAAPVLTGKALLERAPKARAILVNSGQANACTGRQGLENCLKTREMAAELADITADEVLPLSTGVIGNQFNMDKWARAMGPLAEELAKGDDPEPVAKAMMTTDTVRKLVSAQVELSGGTVNLMGMAKGAGMIAPNMATLLVIALTDAEVEPDWWQGAVRRAADTSFNRVTIDGDTSTNDTLLALANGASGVRVAGPKDEAAMEAALTELCRDLAYRIVADAEGGTRVARILVTGAATDQAAELVARAVGHSPLVKTALFGGDANWGRVVAAAGRAGATFDPDKLVLKFGQVVAFSGGTPAGGDLDQLLTPLMKEPEVLIHLDLGSGDAAYELLASDLSKEYVAINADYRT